MGQALRMISYDDVGNRRHAVSAFRLGDNIDLNWYRLDDGVMGGRSSTNHTTSAAATAAATATTIDNLLHFQGTINTNGGGFCSIRSTFPAGYLQGTSCDDYALKIRYKGDGKTYKLLLSDGTRGGPMASQPSWQVDLPTNNVTTTKTTSDGHFDNHKDDAAAAAADNDDWQEQVISLTKFVPSFAGSRRSTDDYMRYKLHPKEMKEIGIMLSLRLSDGRPNPVETYGEGIFSFSLQIQSIEFLKTMAVAVAGKEKEELAVPIEAAAADKKPDEL